MNILARLFLMLLLVQPSWGAEIRGSGGGGVTGWPTVSTTKEITWANAIANAVRIGDGTTPICIYTDATLGGVIKPCTDSDTRTYIWTNFNWSLYDIEGDKSVMTMDPDALGAGSGTLTMATSEQFVASNLGIEFAESDTPPNCAAGNYNIYADTSEATLKKCVNGVATVLTPTTKSFYLSARMFEGDGTQCPARPTVVTISNMAMPSFICTEHDSARMRVVIPMRSDWNAGTIQIKPYYSQTAADTGSVALEVAAACRALGTAFNGTYGTIVEVDDAAVVGSGAIEGTLSAAVTPNGTCAAGDMLFIHIDVDAADNPTTAAATLNFLGADIFYTAVN